MTLERFPIKSAPVERKKSRPSIEPEPQADPIGLGSALELRQVTVRVGTARLIEDVSLRVEPGRVVVVLGANGAGKSTALGVLAGDLRPTSGTATLDDADVRALSPLTLARNVRSTRWTSYRWPIATTPRYPAASVNACRSLGPWPSSGTARPIPARVIC
jgi:ABC-type glutathione transport system ATPase component